MGGGKVKLVNFIVEIISVFILNFLKIYEMVFKSVLIKKKFEIFKIYSLI